MTKPQLYLDNTPLVLGKRIGRGGEGEVYLVSNYPRTAVKIYTGARNVDREAKVIEMVQHGLAGKSNLVAFPKGVIKAKDGQFAGFIMNVIEGHRALHELYGPKSRKTYYPKADFRFLIRTAMNVARAMGQVHQSPCVIGDVNHSGILVSENATVAIIDADSFQFEANGKRYPCLVGVPDFTPPELQGASLHGKIRNKYHDYFGLGVAIFQLLFMGRHPYAGQYAGQDLALEQLIGKNLFAYSRVRKTGVSPPGYVANLDDFPTEVADAFERAFGLHPTSRPGPSEWIDLLQLLEKRLNHCSANPMHYYPSHAKGCPWCRMENSIGAILFVSPLIGVASANVEYTNFNIDRVWTEIESVILPTINGVQPRLSTILINKPSEDARKAKGRIKRKKICGAAIILAAIVAWYYTPNLFLIWLGIAAIGRAQFKSGISNQKYWKDKFIETHELYDTALNEWLKQLGIPRLHETKAGLKQAADEFRGLSQLKAQALGKLKTERQNRQLHEYLDKFLIRHATIPGIAHGKTVTLASFGIESAADITWNSITKIPGFGEATANKLLGWKAQCEKRFKYNPAPSPADKQAESRIENEFAAKAKNLINRLSAGSIELRQMVAQVQKRLASENLQLSHFSAAKKQMEIDLSFLGIDAPSYTARKINIPSPASTSAATTTLNRPVTNTTPSNQAQSASTHVRCPRCSSSMVRRTARKGRNRGNTFWGCSRFPRCKGTRP